MLLIRPKGSHQEKHQLVLFRKVTDLNAKLIFVVERGQVDFTWLSVLVKTSILLHLSFT